MQVRWRWKWMLFTLAGLVFGPPVGVTAYADLRAEQGLQADGVTTPAAVTDTRILDGKNGPEHGLRYAFAVPGHPEPFTLRGDFVLPRKNLWATLPETDWDAAQRAGTVDVVYLPTDPWRNRPVVGNGATMLDLWTATLFGAAMGLWGVFGGAFGVWQYLKVRRRPPGGPLECVLFELVRK